MGRIKRAMMVAGFSIAAGVAGYALGLVFAPTSGAKTRRRWTRRAGDEWSSMSRSAERMFERISACAKREIDERMRQVAEATARKRD